MKNLITILLLIIASYSYSQQEPQVYWENSLIGKWEYVNTTNLNDSIIKSSIKNIELEIIYNGTFKMTNKEIIISGNWQLDDLTLKLITKHDNSKNSKIENMLIHKFTESQLSIVHISEENYPEKSLLVFRKIE